MADPQIENIMGEIDSAGVLTEGPTIGTEDGTQQWYNIMDPTYSLEGGKIDGKDTKSWKTAGINLAVLPPIEPQEPETCEQKCAETMRKQKENCGVLRKRVAMALKKAGCPSKVTALAGKKKVCSKSKPKKKAGGSVRCGTKSCSRV